MKKRDRFEFIQMLLNAIPRSKNVSNFAMYANLDYRACKRYLALMQRYQLIEKNSEFYVLTDNGKTMQKILSVYDNGKG